MKRAKAGQTVLEYAILLSVMCAVFLAMFVYVKGSMSSRIYVTQQRINEAVR